MKTILLILAALGAIVPYAFFGPYFLREGTDIVGFVRLLFANLPSAGFASDILISSTVFWLWSWHEAQRHGMRHWWIYVFLNLSIGLSCALPLFLYMRLCRIEQTDGDHAAAPSTVGRSSIASSMGTPGR